MDGKVADYLKSLFLEIEGEIDNINLKGAKAFEEGNYSKAREYLDKVSQLESLKTEILGIQTKWIEIIGDEGKKVPNRRKFKKKTPKGLQTHEDEYRLPILQALVELGGSSNLQKVIDRVGEIMNPVLNKYDYMPLKSDPGTPKWRNRTQWVRYRLVKEGHLKDDSPTGIWEITPKGRKLLEESEKS